MKIAYISSPYLADTDLPLLRELRYAGHEVIYFLLVSPSSKQASVINIPELKPKAGIYQSQEFPSLKHLRNYLPASQIRIVNMPKAHDWAWSSLSAINKLYKYVNSKDFDLVHLTSPLRYGAFALYGLKNKIMTVHDPIPHSSDRNPLNHFHRAVAWGRIKNFIILSESLKDTFIRAYKLKNKSVQVTGLSIYDMLQKVPAEPIADLPENFILFEGSINPHKGIKYLCEAMEKLPSDLHLVIAGRGKFNFNIDDFASHLPIHIINRYVTNGELRTLIERSKMVVCPYIDATQSGVIMSAFALNTPVVATNTGALAEEFMAERHGKIVPPKDSDALAKAISEMLEPGVIETMAENIAHDFSEGEHSWATLAQKTIEAYKKVIG